MVTEKIEKFAQAYPRLGASIKAIKKNANEITVIFNNTSTITCVAPTENARGYRANILIIDNKNLSRYIEIYICNWAISVKAKS